MAEAAVEERPSSKFYCHMCNVQFQTASANFTCPHCSDGFIEELQEPPESNNEVEVDDWEDEDVMDLMTTLPQLMEERRAGRSRADRSGRRYAVASRSRTLSRPRTLTRLASSNLRQHVPFENLLQDFIVNLGVGVNWGAGGNMQLFLGNPGDYAWGREGLDTIVTQLLNQMDGTGPPPVSKEVIDAIPLVEVSDSQVNTKLQCSVCWEDFLLKENVKQLPCTHIYHEPCIRPWLELHGTCPICRQNLIGSEQQQQNGSGNNQDIPNVNVNNGGNSTFSMLRNLFPSQQNSSSSQSNSGSYDNGGPTRPRANSDSRM